MNDTGRTILEMLRDGQISLEEAERLFDAYIETQAATLNLQPGATDAPVPNADCVPSAPTPSAGDSSATTASEASGTAAAGTLPWADDEVFRIAAFVGHSFVKVGPAREPFRARLEGPLRDVVCFGQLECGDIAGNADAGADIECGNVLGSVHAGGSAECGDVGGSVTAGGSLDCGDIAGDATACGTIDGGDIGGNASAGGDIDCGDIGGNAIAYGGIDCGDIGGSAMGSAGEFGREDAGPGFQGFADFMNSPEWKTARENWERQARDYRDIWKNQSQEFAEGMKRAAQDMSGAAQRLARDLKMTFNESFRPKDR